MFSMDKDIVLFKTSFSLLNAFRFKEKVCFKVIKIFKKSLSLITINDWNLKGFFMGWSIAASHQTCIMFEFLSLKLVIKQDNMC